MYRITTVPNDARITMGSITVPFRSMCSLVGAPFVGTIKATYRPGSRVPEYNSVEEFARSLDSQVMTHEEVARAAYDAFAEALGEDYSLRVDVYVHSAAHPDAWAMIGDVTLDARWA